MCYCSTTFSLFIGKEEQTNVISHYFYRFEFSVVSMGYECPESDFHVPSHPASFAIPSDHNGSSWEALSSELFCELENLPQAFPRTRDDLLFRSKHRDEN